MPIAKQKIREYVEKKGGEVLLQTEKKKEKKKNGNFSFLNMKIINIIISRETHIRWIEDGPETEATF